MCPDNNSEIPSSILFDLVDIEVFKKVLDSFYNLTGIPNGLLSNDAQIISKSGWSNACEFFHRVNPQSNRDCLLNNKDWIHTLKEKEIISASCKNGLLTYATPIVVQNQPIAILFLGQIFDTSFDLEFFKEQSLKFGFNEKAYIESIKKVPIVSKNEIESLIECIVNIAEMLAKCTSSKFEKISVEKNLEKVLTEKIDLLDILRLTPNGIGWSNSNGEIEYINERFTKLFGYTLEDIPTIEIFRNKAYSFEYQKEIINPWIESLKENRNSSILDLEVNIKCKDQTTKHVIIKTSFLGEKVIASFTDITEHWKVEQRNKSNQKILEMIARAEPLSNILYEIIKIIEAEDLESICSLLLLDKDEKHLLNNIKNRLPLFYNDAIDGIEIGMGAGSCGTAAFLRKRVIVEDIMNHPYWEKYKDLANKANLASCWSEPIISSNNQILGTFAIYHETANKPNNSDLERMAFAVNIASIAIENSNNRQKLEILAYTDYLTGLRNRRSFIEQAETELYRSLRYDRKFSLIMFDIDYFKGINDTFGHSVGDLVLQEIAKICRDLLREIDIIGRIGGEEFAILLPETDIQNAVQVAQRLCDTISENKLFISDKKIKFTASFGVVFADKLNMLTIDELLNQADNALYQAKKGGRNRVCVVK